MLFLSIDYDHICENSIPTLRFVGFIIAILKVLIPIIIIGIGIYRLMKEIGIKKKNKPKIKKAIKGLVMRIVLGIVIFFLPSFIGIIIPFASDPFDLYSHDHTICVTCFTEPWRCK